MGGVPIIASAARTITGARRSSNQDRFVVDAELGFAFLADGVAGRPAGEQAAEAAIRAASLQLQLVLANGHCPDAHTAHRLLVDAFRFADATVQARGDREEGAASMATTLVGVLFMDGQAVIANLGNSRVYRLRHAFLKQLTDDHVVHRPGLDSLSAADVAAIRPLQLLTRAVGYPLSGDPDVCVEPLFPRDVFLLCSNGLSDVLERHHMGEVLARAPSLDHACELLVAAAVEMGSEDDITAVLVQPASRAGEAGG